MKTEKIHFYSVSLVFTLFVTKHGFCEELVYAENEAVSGILLLQKTPIPCSGIRDSPIKSPKNNSAVSCN